jgi:hypothetical protein
MDTEDTKKPAAKPRFMTKPPANRAYVFAKNCTNDHGAFVKGDKARGAFSPALIASYLAAGILVHVNG